MDSVGIRELKRDTSAIIKRVREEKEPVEITLRGEVVARIVPVESPSDLDEFVESAEDRAKRLQALWKNMDELAERMSEDEGESAGMSAVEAVREQRREL